MHLFLIITETGFGCAYLGRKTGITADQSFIRFGLFFIFKEEEIMTTGELLEILKRDAVSIYSEEELIKKLNCGKKLKIKLGRTPAGLTCT